MSKCCWIVLPKSKERKTMLKKLMPLATYLLLLGVMLYAEFVALRPVLIADEGNSIGVFMGYVVMLAILPPTGRHYIGIH